MRLPIYLFNLFIYQLSRHTGLPRENVYERDSDLMGGATLPGSKSPTYSFRIMMRVLLRPTRTNQWKCCETGPTVFRPYPRRLESLTICRSYYQGSTFFSVILRPWVLVRPGFKPAASELTRRRSFCIIIHDHTQPSHSIITVKWYKNYPLVAFASITSPIFLS